MGGFKRNARCWLWGWLFAEAFITPLLFVDFPSIMGGLDSGALWREKALLAMMLLRGRKYNSHPSKSMTTQPTYHTSMTTQTNGNTSQSNDSFLTIFTFVNCKICFQPRFVGFKLNGFLEDSYQPSFYLIQTNARW